MKEEGREREGLIIHPRTKPRRHSTTPHFPDNTPFKSEKKNNTTLREIEKEEERDTQSLLTEGKHSIHDFSTIETTPIACYQGRNKNGNAVSKAISHNHSYFNRNENYEIC